MTQAEKLAEQGYVTVAFVAEKLGRHISSVYRMLEDKVIEGLHIGRSWYVKRDSLIKYLGPDAAKALGFMR